MEDQQQQVKEIKREKKRTRGQNTNGQMSKTAQRKTGQADDNAKQETR